MLTAITWVPYIIAKMLNRSWDMTLVAKIDMCDSIL